MVWNPTLDVNPFYFPGGSVGCLLVHGFTGSSLEMRGLGEYLAARGYTVRGPLLPGHGTSPEDMATTNRHDWLREAEADFRRLQAACSKVFVAGLSMGGVISLILASKYPVDGVITMSTPAPLRAWQVKTLLLLRRFLRWLPGSGWVANLTAPQASNHPSSYNRTPMASVVELVRLIGRLGHTLPRVYAPVLIIQSTGDHVISPSSAQFIHDYLGSADKTVRFFHNSGHNITVDREREAVWRTVGDFIARVAGR
jgi:carboxylesterase